MVATGRLLELTTVRLAFVGGCNLSGYLSESSSGSAAAAEIARTPQKDGVDPVDLTTSFGVNKLIGFKGY